ncbi:MAG: outer membrane lipoprotein carrier protein LolA [Lysinibacillus sp.]
MKRLVYSTALALTMALAGCSTGETYTPQEIVAQTLEETTEVKSYYGEYEMDMGDEDVSHIKEWVKDGKRRIELSGSDGEQYITINDGKQLTSFDVSANTIQIFEYPDDKTAALSQQSPKEQADMLLELIEDTHEITLGKEEKIAGRDTYQLVAKVNDKNSLMGDLEVWVDKENWMALKTVSNSGGLTMTTEYTKLELQPDLEDSLFVLEIPEGAVVERIDAGSYGPKESSIEEAKAALGSFLVFKEEAGLSLRSVEDMEVEERPEFAFNYNVNDEPAFTLSVLKPSADVTDVGADLGTTKIKIRGVDGEQLDMNKFRYIQWTEGGYQYGVILDNEELSFEQAYKYIEKMEIVQ